MIPLRLAAGAVAFLLALPSAEAASLTRSYAYFTVHGSTAADLDRELRNRGPFLESDRSHHAGASTMRFETTVRYRLSGPACSIARADVALHATITLPRWEASRPPTDPYLVVIWDTLTKDIRRHEEGHVQIAQRHAQRLETELRALPALRGCNALKKRVAQTTKSELARDARDQRAYDRSEQAGFKQRFAHLLDLRLKKLGQ
jgi:predicted secreted Zn-dependent protease